MAAEYQTIECTTAAEWRHWLDQHHDNTDGVWLRIYKKASGVATVTQPEALDQVLCYGWIDGQRKSYDAESYVQKYTPRRACSLWSKRNIEHIARLSQAGLMTPAGEAQVVLAKADGRWQAAYDAAVDMVVPDDFIAAAQTDAKVWAFYQTLNKTNRFAIAWRLQTARTPETRQRRFDKLLAMLQRGEKIH